MHVYHKNAHIRTPVPTSSPLQQCEYIAQYMQTDEMSIKAFATAFKCQSRPCTYITRTLHQEGGHAHAFT